MGQRYKPRRNEDDEEKKTDSTFFFLRHLRFFVVCTNLFCSDLDLNRCYVIGDRYRDIEAGHAVGARGVMVLTGFGREEYETGRRRWPRQPDHVAEELGMVSSYTMDGDTTCGKSNFSASPDSTSRKELYT